jgi:putative ABC transport system ATP-binding protein
MESIVFCEKVSKIYHVDHIRVSALEKVDLEIPRGQFVTLAGPSGSGKTTLLNVVGGLDQPSEGRITLQGRRIDQLSPAEMADLRLEQVGFVFQAYNLIPVLTAQENVEFVMEQQRIAVARAIVSRPSIVLADEPTANLDSQTANELVRLMLSLNDRHHTTFLISTHDPMVMDLAPRQIKLRDGRIVDDQVRS